MCIASDFIRGPKKRGGRLSDSGHCLGTLRYYEIPLPVKYIAILVQVTNAW